VNGMICPRCGNRIDANQQFCMNCGFQLPVQTPAYNQPTSKGLYGNTLKTPGYAIALIVVSSFLLLGVLLFGAWRIFLDKPVVEVSERNISASPSASSAAQPSISATPSSPTPTVTPTPTPVPSPSPSPMPTLTPSPSLTTESDINTLYEQVAFSKFTNNPKWDDLVKRWETPIRVELMGNPSEADYNAINDFMILLTEHVPWLDIAFMEGEGSTLGNMEIHFVAQSEMKDIIPGALQDDRSYYYLNWNNNAQLTKAQISLSTDTLSQEERNHIIVENIVHCLGLTGYLSGRPDSILFDQISTTPILSEVDYTLIMMHYSAVTHAGQLKSEALEALKNVS